MILTTLAGQDERSPSLRFDCLIVLTAQRLFEPLRHRVLLGLQFSDR